MANLKYTFVEKTVILSSEVNTNFYRLETMYKFENLSSQVNGIIVQFSTAENYVAGTLEVYVNGLLATPTEDIQEDGTNKFTTLFALPLESGTKLVVKYTQQF